MRITTDGLHHYTGGAPDAFGLDADFAQLTKDGPKASGVRPDRVSHRVTTFLPFDFRNRVETPKCVERQQFWAT